MSIPQRNTTLGRLRPYVGPYLWIASVQYLLMQWVVASAWRNPTYSWRNNAISDLGATMCGTFAARYMCSPNHLLMNISFVVLGLTTLVGAALLYRQFAVNRGSRIGFAMLAVAGFGTALVGIFPEDADIVLHGFGAGLSFFLGDAALVVLGLSLAIPRWLKVFSVLSGVVSLLALGSYSTGHFFFLGLGGIERLAGYPQTLWLIVFGVYAALLVRAGNR
jgi:hypothetical membrane protein